MNVLGSEATCQNVNQLKLVKFTARCIHAGHNSKDRNDGVENGDFEHDRNNILH